MPDFPSPQKILIVDDEPRNQRIIIESLEDLPVDFKTAASGEEALELAESFLPDLLLLDIMMPGIDGYSVCKRLRADARFNLTKIILVSGRAMIDERLRGYAEGADEYITKPFATEELTAKVNVFLRLNRVEKDLFTLNQSLDQLVTDRTRKLIEVESKLVQSTKMSALGEMAGGIAHEINTPLGTIGLITEQIMELMEDDTIDRPLIQGMLKTVSGTVHRISRIIEGLRTFSRDGGQDQFVTTSVKSIIDNTLSLCTEKLKHVKITLTVEPISEFLVIDCSPVQISQVLLNLIGNASDAIQSLPEKWIRISASENGKSVEIRLTDSGTGIRPEIRERIFEPFFTTKKIGKGTGLGLSISQGIIEAHQGRIQIDLKGPNTCFVLSLPRKN